MSKIQGKHVVLLGLSAMSLLQGFGCIAESVESDEAIVDEEAIDISQSAAEGASCKCPVKNPSDDSCSDASKINCGKNGQSCYTKSESGEKAHTCVWQ
jgi:hypothetical protein